MSRWDRQGWYQTAPKKPPPEHGIKMKKSGATWWGQRWIEALQEVLRGDSGRLARGRTYARAGRTHELTVKDGEVTARVTGSRPTPYKVTIKLTQLPESAWKKAIAGMTKKAQFAAELLAGQMPKDIGEVFREAGTNLFPAERTEFVTSCTCPDWGNPCKHVAATHYVLGEALDRDPFLLFELRGRTKEQVLGALRAARSGEAPMKVRRGAAKTMIVAEPEIAKVSLGKLSPADYDRPREALPVLHLSFEAPAAHGAVLRQLGAPVGWSGETPPVDLLSPLVCAAAEKARRIALAEQEDVVDPGDPPLNAAGTRRKRTSGSGSKDHALGGRGGRRSASGAVESGTAPRLVELIAAAARWRAAAVDWSRSSESTSSNEVCPERGGDTRTNLKSDCRSVRSARVVLHKTKIRLTFCAWTRLRQAARRTVERGEQEGLGGAGARLSEAARAGRRSGRGGGGAHAAGGGGGG